LLVATAEVVGKGLCSSSLDWINRNERGVRGMQLRVVRSETHGGEGAKRDARGGVWRVRWIFGGTGEARETAETSLVQGE